MAMTLEEILQQLGCKKPFRNDGELTHHGYKTYCKLTKLLYGIGTLTETNMNDVVETLDIIANETPN